jgi:hypothetical protein
MAVAACSSTRPSELCRSLLYLSVAAVVAGAACAAVDTGLPLLLTQRLLLLLLHARMLRRHC